MGRSVWTNSRALETVFFSFAAGYCPKCECGTSSFDSYDCPECDTELELDGDYTHEWEWLVDDIRAQFTERFPSFDTCDEWVQDESRAIARNELCDVVISEYCGLVSLGVVPTGEDDWYDNTAGLAESWTRRCAAPFLRNRWQQLNKVGTFSNGEAVFQKVA